MGNVDAVKREVCDSLSKVGVCAAPYTSNACADLHGCFQQDTLQRTCYHKAGVSPPRAVVQLCRARSVMQSSSAKMRSEGLNKIFSMITLNFSEALLKR
mmetsp:Transcript_31165/g.61021  ORF Transcript_31165/g.61021 Transcript_31165/m.61021 type:complete len:99 (-) Transcript_31165:680-976(-)